MAKYLDLAGLQTLWAKIKGTFIAQNATVTDGHVAVFTVDDSGDATIVGLADGGATNNHSHPVVSSSAAGFAPQMPTTNSTTISSQANEWVLTTTSGGTPSWRKLPSNAFKNDTYTVNNGTFQIAGNGTAANTLFTANGATAVGINFANGTGNTVSVTAASGSTAAKVVINNDHTKTSITEKTSYPTGTSASANGGTITVRDVTVNADGHVTGTQDRTITLSQAAITRNVTKSNAAVTANHLVAWNANANAGADGVVKDSGYIVETSLSGGASAIPTSAAVSAAISGLSGAMHFVGTSTDTMTDGQTTNPTVSNVSSFSAGDVVVDATETEFVLGKESTPKWHKLGDANSYALSSVSVTGTGVLGGGGTLTQNRTITHNTSALGISEDTQYGPGADVTGSDGTMIKVPQITVDKYGHITAVTERTYTSVNNTYTVNNAALNLQGSSGNAIASGFSANGSTATTFKFAVGTGNTISSIGVTKSSATNTITINGATMPTTLKNPNAVRLGNDTTYIDYDGSASGCQLSFTGSGVSLAKSGNVVTATITNTTYTLPVAKYNTLGGLKPAYTTTGAATGYTAASNTSTPALNARTTTAGKYYAIEADKDGVAFVNVPWTSANNAKLQVKGSASDATATDTGFTANASSPGVITFARSGASVTSVTTSGGTVTINGVDSLKNPNSLTIGTKPSSTGTATNSVVYDGSASGKAIYFSTANASNTNVQFAIDSNGFITGTVTESDTKNTAGTTDKTATKMFLVGATSQGANPQTYSDQHVYIGTDDRLYCKNSGGNVGAVYVSGDFVEITTEEINALS